MRLRALSSSTAANTPVTLPPPPEPSVPATDPPRLHDQAGGTDGGLQPATADIVAGFGVKLLAAYVSSVDHMSFHACFLRIAVGGSRRRDISV